MNRRTRAAAGLMLMAGACIPAKAGPLDPPQGPVGPTNREQIMALPFTITAPGSYVVSRNLTSTPTSPGGITIAVSNVSLDLNGFQVINQGGGLSLSAITIASGVSSVTIANGRIGTYLTAWASGINGAGATDCVVSDVQVAYLNGGSSGAAINLGDRARVSRCSATHGDTYAIRVGARSIVTECRSEDFDGSGFIAGDYSVVTNCVSEGNGFVTASQLSAGQGAVIQGCSVGPGINPGGITSVAIGDGGKLFNCTVRNDSAGGVVNAGNRVLISGCNFSQFRINAGSSSRVEHCSVEGPNAPSVPALITAAAGSTIADCTLTGGQSAVDITGPACLVDGNHIASTPLGVNIHGTGSRVVRNLISAASTAISAPSPTNSNDVGPQSVGSSSNSPWANLVN